MAAGNLSDTMYMAESLYLRFDIPAIAPAIIEALEANGSDVSTINTTHVLFTVRSRWGGFMQTVSRRMLAWETAAG